jgi:hypothetical protein
VQRGAEDGSGAVVIVVVIVEVIVEVLAKLLAELFVRIGTVGEEGDEVVIVEVAALAVVAVAVAVAAVVVGACGVARTFRRVNVMFAEGEI